MKRAIQKIGSRPWYGDDFINIQNESLEAIEAHFSGLGNYILSGCVATSNAISAGIVMIDGQLCRYSGETGITFPRYLKKVITEVDSENYETGGSKSTYETVYAVGQGTNPGGQYILFNGATAPNSLIDKLNASVSINANQVTTGTLSSSRIPNLDASKITTGFLNTARIQTESIDPDKIKIGVATWDLSLIPNLPASKVTSGTLSVSRLPNLDASKITTGIFSSSRIPSLDASKITTGILSLSRIPDLPANKITSGTINLNQLPDSVKAFSPWVDDSTTQQNITFRENQEWLHIKGKLNSSADFIDLTPWDGDIFNQSMQYSGYLHAKNSQSLTDGVVTITVEGGDTLKAKLTSAVYQGGNADYDQLGGQDQSTSEVHFDVYIKKI